jgi:hypothetical protein
MIKLNKGILSAQTESRKYDAGTPDKILPASLCSVSLASCARTSAANEIFRRIFLDERIFDKHGNERET